MSTEEPDLERADLEGADPERPDPDRDAGLDLARTIAKQIAGSGLPEGRRRSARRRSQNVVSSASGARPDDRDPQLLGGSMDRLISDLGWEIDLRVHGVFGRWAEIVGAQIAEHCTPETFDGGRLVVRTSSTAWATQLKLLAPNLVARLNEELGHGTVTFIDVQAPRQPSWVKGRYRAKGRGPRDTYG